jgi:hypothetical protein
LEAEFDAAVRTANAALPLLTTASRCAETTECLSCVTYLEKNKLFARYFLHFQTLRFLSNLPLPEGRAGIACEPTESNFFYKIPHNQRSASQYLPSSIVSVNGA